MSYEGYTQVLCANGHLSHFDALDESWARVTSYGFEQPDAEPCAICGAQFVFHHQVDQTNDEGTPMTFEVQEPAVYETCDKGHLHLVSAAKYKIPSKELRP